MSERVKRHLSEDLLLPYLDARLSPGEAEKVESHLARCPECRQQVGELQALMTVMNDWTAPEPSDHFEAAVREQLAAENRKASSWAWWRARPAWSAGLALAALLIVAVGLMQSPLVPGPSTPSVVEVEPADLITTPWEELLVQDDSLVVLDNKELLENYELLQDFDILFESLGNGNHQL